MATATGQRVSRTTRHGAVSLVAGFAAGFLLFLAIGSNPNDAVFSALSLSILVAISRMLTQRVLSGY